MPSRITRVEYDDRASHFRLKMRCNRIACKRVFMTVWIEMPRMPDGYDVEPHRCSNCGTRTSIVVGVEYNSQRCYPGRTYNLSDWAGQS